ncbi:MAG: YggS family pyridoxal phosphate-dependent enzyme [Thermoleophilaceae bacterium]|nr:YggS family pyridoxal phosphate-dependent enzyme [Thermoleophilaceae bacterium]
MANLSADLATVEYNLGVVRERVAEACARSGRAPESVRICVATKYVEPDAMAVLRDAGVTIAAENRLQDMIAKQERFGDDFEWHFIGAIQSKKIREIAGRVSMIHSLATESARDKLANLEPPVPSLLVQVNVSGEESKQGVAPEELAAFIAATPHPVSGLMTMPPLTDDPEGARAYFARLKQLADEQGLNELSMGTSQDFAVAVEEGATLIRVGSVLFSDPNK